MNLAMIMGIIAAIPQLLGLINETVKEVESVFAGAPGTVKFAAAEAKVNSVLAAVTTDAAMLADMQKVAAPLINGAVAMFRAGGVFKPTSPKAVTPSLSVALSAGAVGTGTPGVPAPSFGSSATP